MNNLIQMLFQQKMKQIPQNMMSQLESQLKARNPPAYQEFQQARKNNENPNEYLNKIVGGFNEDQKKQWNNMMGQFNQQNKQG